MKAHEAHVLAERVRESRDSVDNVGVVMETILAAANRGDYSVSIPSSIMTPATIMILTDRANQYKVSDDINGNRRIYW